MKILMVMILAVCGPALLLFGVGYAFAFPWHTLAIVAVVVGGPLAWVIGGAWREGAALGAKWNAERAEREQSEDADFLRLAMIPDYDPERTVLAPAPSPIINPRRAADAPRQVKPGAWARSMGSHLRG